jgi:acyl-CoA thioester hydrolase
MTAPRPTVTLPVTVEFEDVDAYGIAHHTRLIAYLERARLRLLFDDAGLLTARTTLPVMYELDLKFHKSAKLLDALTVTAEIVELGDMMLSLRYQIRRPSTDELLLRAKSVVAFADVTTGTLVPVPPALKARFEGGAS